MDEALYLSFPGVYLALDVKDSAKYRIAKKLAIDE